MTPAKRKLDKIIDEVCNWGNQFIKTRYFEELTEEQKDSVESVVLSFTEHMYTDHRLTPEKWRESALEKVCLHTLPEMMVSGEAYFASMAPVLSAFFEFLAEKRLINNASGLAKKVREIHEQIIQNASNPENWNFGKTILMAAVDAGVDVTSIEEMNKFCENIIGGPLADSIVEKALEKDESPYHVPGAGRKHKKKKKKEEKKEIITQESLNKWIRS